MDATRSGIPTLYKGIRFRSRLEAKWAVFFDLVGWSWVYEPFDLDGYIPDFLITGQWPLVAEIGPVSSQREYVEKSAKADARPEQIGRDVIVLGLTPVVPFRGSVVDPDNPTAGWLGEQHGPIDLDFPVNGSLTEPAGFTWDTGLWGRCFKCGSLGVVHSMLSYCLRPCGHHQSGSFGDRVNVDWLNALWARATNDVQWMASKPERVGDVITRAALT